MRLPAARPNLITLVKRSGWIPVLIILAALVMIAPVPLPATAPTERVIRIEASMFAFSPSEIQINPGDKVTIELVSTDVVHGLSLDGYDFELSADPGQTAAGTFLADRPGVFRFRCSAACGNLHPFMIGKLQIGPNLLLMRGIVLGILAVAGALLLTRQLPGFGDLTAQ